MVKHRIPHRVRGLESRNVPVAVYIAAIVTLRVYHEAWNLENGSKGGKLESIPGKLVATISPLGSNRRSDDKLRRRLTLSEKWQAENQWSRGRGSETPLVVWRGEHMPKRT